MHNNLDPNRHTWDVSPAEAKQIQLDLQKRVVLEDNLGCISYVAGVDVAFLSASESRAAVAVLSFPNLELVEFSTATRPTAFPYIPGLLSFREVPVILDALGKLDRMPDLLLCDGQGIAHPRRFGLACHLGVLSDLPAIGVAKKRLIGRHQPLPVERGSRVPLFEDEKIIGTVLRTRTAVKPVFVSPGHKVTIETAVHLVMDCVTRYRLPETTRWAHRLATGHGPKQCSVRSRPGK